MRWGRKFCVDVEDKYEYKYISLRPMLILHSYKYRNEEPFVNGGADLCSLVGTSPHLRGPILVSSRGPKTWQQAEARNVYVICKFECCRLQLIMFSHHAAVMKALFSAWSSCEYFIHIHCNLFVDVFTTYCSWKLFSIMLLLWKVNNMVQFGKDYL